jgi:CcmD family protein
MFRFAQHDIFDFLDSPRESGASNDHERISEMLFQDTPANTMNYMIAGYTVIFGVMLAYMISLVVRQRNLEREMKELEEMERKG